MGFLKIERTWFALDLEGSVHGEKTTLKAAADGVFDELKAGVETSATYAWKSKYTTSLETEFSQWDKLGDDTSSVILALDLRPISDLLNPILVRPVPLAKLPVVRDAGDYGDNVADQWYELAPVVWYQLRSSFADWLRTNLGVNGPITLTTDKDLSPSMRQISFSPMVMSASSSGAWPRGLYFDKPSLGIALPALSGTSSSEPAYVVIGTGTGAEIPTSDGSASYPTLTYITRPSAPLAVAMTLTGHFAVTEVDPQGDGSGPSTLGTIDINETVSIVNGAFSLSKSFTVEQNGFFNWSSVGGETITLTLSGVITDQGAFGNAD
jgi:hypothetical protein